MCENLLIPVVRYLEEDLTRGELEDAITAGHVTFLAKAFDLNPEELIDTVRRGRAERQMVLGIQQGATQDGIFTRRVADGPTK